MSTIHTLQTPSSARQTLVCLHSSGSSARQWQPYRGALDAYWELAMPPLIGYDGQRRWPTGAPASLDDEARQLAPLLQPGGVHLLGHSYGAAVALQLALRWPQRVRSLTLYEPVRFALLLQDASTQAAGESIVGVGRRIGLQVMSGNLHAAAEMFVDYWAGAGRWRQLGPIQQRALAERMPKVQAEFEAVFADRVPAAAYAGLSMPVRLIGGSRSPLPSRQVLDLLARQLPQATVCWLDGLGHMAPVEAPQRVIEALGAMAAQPALREAA